MQNWDDETFRPPAQKTLAKIDDIGVREIARLRMRCHGRPVSQTEVTLRIVPYMIRHLISKWQFRPERRSSG